jgi:hypothetical protein
MSDRSSNDTWSFATNIKIFFLFISISSDTTRVLTSAVAAFDVLLHGSHWLEIWKNHLKGPKHDQVEGEFFYIKQTRMVR